MEDEHENNKLQDLLMDEKGFVPIKDALERAKVRWEQSIIK